ncbi:type I toxin-antitoxin system Ibs family toxin, partial [Escherichia coli]
MMKLLIIVVLLVISW